MLMTLSGNVLFIGFLYWEKVYGRSITQSMRYRAMTATLLAYAVPWKWLNGVYGRILGFFWREETITDERGLFGMADIRTGKAIFRTEEYRVLMLLTGIWFAVAVSLVMFKAVRHVKRCNALRGLAIPCPDERLEGIVGRLRKELGCRHSPAVVWTRVDNETITLGILKPVIYLQKEYTENELYLILKHEMIHIVRMDLLIKLLQEFVSCVHWFNPLVHLLVHEIQFVCEASCDERAAEGGGEGEGVEAYADLLDKNKKSKKLKVAIGRGFEDSDKEMDKRIQLVRRARKVSYRERIAPTGAFLLLVFVSSLTALAYPKVRHIEDTVMEYAENFASGGNCLLYQYEKEGYDIFAGALVYEEQFIDQEGKNYPIASGSAGTVCTSHDLVQGYYKKHIRADGGCVVETYGGAKCRNCGTVEIGNLCLTTEQEFCAHRR